MRDDGQEAASRMRDSGFALPPEIPLAQPGDEIPSDIAPKLPNKPFMKEAKSARPAWQELQPDQNQMPQMAQQGWQSAAPRSNVLPKTVAAPVPSFDGSAPATPAPASPSPMMAMPVMPKPVFSGSPDKNHDEGGDDQSAQLGMDGEETQAAGTPFNVSNQQQHEANGKTVTGMQAHQPMQVPEFVQQAHVMMKDGGGEMRVILRPEGLGEVAMKVSVNGDKVNVQMITQSVEAKKLLENSFHALKEGLSAHQLNLESVKIDTASNLGKQFDQRYRIAQRSSRRANS